MPAELPQTSSPGMRVVCSIPDKAGPETRDPGGCDQLIHGEPGLEPGRAGEGVGQRAAATAWARAVSTGVKVSRQIWEGDVYTRARIQDLSKALMWGLLVPKPKGWVHVPCPEQVHWGGAAQGRKRHPAWDREV